jgi:Cu2+-containing amine oxidase
VTGLRLCQRRDSSSQLCFRLAIDLAPRAITYAMMSDGSDTLDTWTARDHAIGNRDIVAWYTMGFHHIPRMEDWPVMPTHWSNFSLMPHNFFANNPALAVPNGR